jgi:DNA-directed RNA polymerase alpha subunit
MLIKLLVARLFENRVHPIGALIDVDNDTAKRWIKSDLAEIAGENPVKEPADSVTPPVKTGDSIDELDLPPRVIELLKENSIATITDLLKVEHFEDLEGIGKAIAASIRAAIADRIA